MNFDDQIRRYFGIENLAAVPQDAPGIECMKVNLGLTKDRGERFGLWAIAIYARVGTGSGCRICDRSRLRGSAELHGPHWWSGWRVALKPISTVLDLGCRFILANVDR